MATRRPLHQYKPSPALSLLSRPGLTGVRTRRVAVLVATGVERQSVEKLYTELLADGAVPRLVGSKLGKIETRDGGVLDVEVTLETSPAVLYDGVVVPDGGEALDAWMEDARALEFMGDQFRHCKPMLFASSDSSELFHKAGIPIEMGIPVTGGRSQADLGVFDTQHDDLDQALRKFKTALAGHRPFGRENLL
jgi:catalase